MATGTTTILAVEAALKYLYPNGEAPEVINKEYKWHQALKKQTDFKGEWAYIALKNANPQGVGPTVSTAQTNRTTSVFNRFTLTRNKFFGVARIDGEAAAAAVRTEGALVDLVSSEVNGIAQSVTHDLAVYEYGSGNAILAAVLTGANTTTLTLAADTNMNNLELGMFVNFVSDTTLSPTVRSGSPYLTAIDRLNKTITLSAAVATQVATDYVVRAGMAASAATASVFFGLDKYIEGGTNPSAIYGLTRNTDPVRLAGQTAAYTSQAMEDAVLDAHAKTTLQGVGTPDTLIANPIRVSQMKRSIGGKIMYDRNSSDKAGIGFSKVMFETESGPVEVLSDPYCPLSSAYLVRKKDWTLWSLNAAPHMAQDDSLKYLRVSDDDSFEVRWRFYGAKKLDNPACQFRLTGFGA